MIVNNNSLTSLGMKRGPGIPGFDALQDDSKDTTTPCGASYGAQRTLRELTHQPVSLSI